MVGNIGRIEGSGSAYRFYAEGYTPSLITLLEALDAERLAVASAYGAQVPGIHHSVRRDGISRTWAWPARPWARSARSWRRDRLADPPALSHLAGDRVVYWRWRCV